MSFKKWLLIFLCSFFVASLPLATTGCRGTLDPAGEYRGDKILYTADKTITEAYDAMHAFVKFEFQNRAALARNPEIKESADAIRSNAETWIGTAIAMRDAYAGSPTADGRAQLEQALAVLRQAIVEASKYISTKGQ